ncbi:sensor domain-containing diguanylate cyclase [Lachnospiraceae bacterium]|nr:sensor domain-containing diguanylate cyclase [Lachnospiraceae bacterium]
MQKIFIRYVFVIMSAAVFMIFVINCLFTIRSLETQQYKTFYTKSEQMIHTLENNQMELSIVKKNLDEDYLTRARAAAYVLDRQKEVSMDVDEMQYLANLLNVDELHMIDENGIIVSASVPQYVGFDMDDHPQTQAFLAILESGDEDAYLIQESQPNAAEGKIMQYVGVARKGGKGIVQVGFKPTRQMEAQSRNTYEYIFSKFPTDVGEELFAVDSSTGEVLGHSAGMGEFTAEYCQLEQLKECTKGAYKQGKNEDSMYVFARKYGDILICAALPQDILQDKLLRQVFSTLVYLLFVEAIVILLLNYLVKQKVVNGIHRIMENLSSITNGNLDTKVTVGGNREFEALSRGINAMVKSIVNISDRISAIIEISGAALAAYEYEPEVNHVFVTSGLRNLLGLSDEKAEELYHDFGKFDQYMQEITAVPIEGEADVYRISDSRYVRIHMSNSQGKNLGVITDVSTDVMEKKQMQYENTHDALTGLHKFSYFKQIAGEILMEMNPGNICAAVMLDLDFFKSVNDTFGHDAGDKYLQCFASVMQSMPLEHFLTARRSGDEFCMMIFGCCDKLEIIRQLDFFYEALRNRRVDLSPEESRCVSASAGFACTKDAGKNIEELLNRADEALYEVKRQTKGCYGEYIG